MIGTVFRIFQKECLDILRDTRALVTVSLVSILAGPIMLLILASMLSTFEAKSERRIIMVNGITHAPSLANHLLRETTQIISAPDNYMSLISNGKLNDPVLEIPNNFETLTQSGQSVTLKLLVNSGNAQSQAAVPRIKRWIESFADEQTSLYLVVQGIAPNIAKQISLEEVDFANPNAEAVKIFGMLPYFLVFAALYGVWSAALEATVGEKEHNTIESLLVTPIKMHQLVLGKWLAVFAIGALVTFAVIVGFVPAQMLIESDTLRAMFNYGWFEVAIATLLLFPLVGLFAALIMAIGYKALSMRQAQANATLLMLLTAFMPMLINLNHEHADWVLDLPVIAQHTHILNMLKGEAISPQSLILCNIIVISLIGLVLCLCIWNSTKLKARS